ncbi:MAG: reverse transcriptase domain-containing protein [Candidatus Altimarinota bacterium]
MNFLEELSNIKTLQKSWKQVKRGKNKQQRSSSRGIDNISIEDFGKDKDTLRINLESIQSDLINKTYKFSNFKPGLIPKPNKEKDRLISILTIRDRVVHRGLLHIINEKAYPQINNGVSFCGIKEDTFKKPKSIKTKYNIPNAIKKLIEKVQSNNFWIAESDIVGFFDNINKKRLKRKISNILGNDKSVQWLLDELLNYDISISKEFLKNPRVPELSKINSKLGIPQGSSISPLLSNIYLLEFDKYLMKIYGDRYIRYADDFIILCKTKKEAKKARNHIRTQLKKEKLNIAPDKTFVKNLKTDSINFLGLKINKFGITTKVELSIVSKVFNEKILNPNNKIYTVKNLPLSTSKKTIKMKSIIKGYFEFYKHYHSKELFEKINTLINKKKGVKAKIFQQLELFNLDKTSPLIPLSDWLSLFN